jgi:hypothetical protein
MPVVSRSSAAVVLIAVTGLGLSAVPAVAEVAATTPPVVTFTVKQGATKVSGAKGLKAGWVTVKATTKDGPHNLWFYQDKHPSKAKAPAGARMRQIPPATPGGETRPTKGGDRTRRISTAGGLEKDILALGGFYLDPKHPVTMRIKLPAGRVSVFDRMTGDPEIVLSVGAAGTAKAPAKPTANITVNDRNVIAVPSTLPAKGVLQISNISAQARNWHDLTIRRLKSGKTAADVKKFFTTYRNDPFVAPKGTSADAAGTAPMSAGRNQQVSYSLAPGTYAVFDAWLDEKGNSNASKGAVKVVKLK